MGYLREGSEPVHAEVEDNELAALCLAELEKVLQEVLAEVHRSQVRHHPFPHLQIVHWRCLLQLLAEVVDIIELFLLACFTGREDASVEALHRDNFDGAGVDAVLGGRVLDDAVRSLQLCNMFGRFARLHLAEALFHPC